MRMKMEIEVVYIYRGGATHGFHLVTLEQVAFREREKRDRERVCRVRHVSREQTHSDNDKVDTTITTLLTQTTIWTRTHP